MNKFTKRCLILCGVLASAGLILCIISVSMGFGWRQLYNLADEGVFEISWVDRGIEIGDQDFDWWDSDDLEDGQWTSGTSQWLGSDIKNLDLEFQFGTVVIEASTSEYLELEVEYRNSWSNGTRKIVWQQKGNSLDIEDQVDKNVLGIVTNGSDQAHLTLRIPDGMEFDELSLDIGAATVKVDTALFAKEMDIVLGAGTMENTGETAFFSGESVDLEIGTGEMNWNGIQAKTLDLECGVGAAAIQNVDASRIQAETGVGSMMLGLIGTQQQYDYKVDCGMGRIVLGSENYSGMGQSKIVDQNGDRYLELDCGMGELVVEFME